MNWGCFAAQDQNNLKSKTTTNNSKPKYCWVNALVIKLNRNGLMLKDDHPKLSSHRTIKWLANMTEGVAVIFSPDFNLTEMLWRDIYRTVEKQMSANSKLNLCSKEERTKIPPQCWETKRKNVNIKLLFYIKGLHSFLHKNTTKWWNMLVFKHSRLDLNYLIIWQIPDSV